MNHRSLGFRLVAWYAGLLSVIFAFVAVSMFLGLQRYLEANLEDSLSRRSRQLIQILDSSLGKLPPAAIVDEINTRMAPEINNRFIRITRANGELFYISGAPSDRSFDPLAIAALPVNAKANSVRNLPIADGHYILILAKPVQSLLGTYSVEIGASTESIQIAQEHLLWLLALMLPVLAIVAIGGGFVLVKRALKPVEEISRTAERITLHQLSERLPVQRTGDEIEQLSVSLNHMIARLDESFQNSRRFLADASHELRTPLTIVKGELEEVARGGRLPDDIRERIGSVLEEVQRLTQIVEGLFALSRLDAGEAQREWVRFDLAELVATTADQMKLLAEDGQIAVDCSALQSVYVEGDRARLKQVIVNLLDNAIKYTPERGTILLKTTVVADRVHLEIADSGIGIPREALPHVFERFFRVDKARSRDMGGAGLGLSIVRSICTAHGAEIEVESTMDRGSRFRIILPHAGEKTAAS